MTPTIFILWILIGFLSTILGLMWERGSTKIRNNREFFLVIVLILLGPATIAGYAMYLLAKDTDG